MEEKNKNEIWREPDWEFIDMASRIEGDWKKDLRLLLPGSERAWLEIFPEAKKIIPAMIKEWERKAESTRLLVKKALRLIEEKSTEENYWFWREVIKYAFPPTQEFMEAKRHMKRLKWSIQRKNKSKAGVSENEIVIAKEQDLVRIAEGYGLHPKKSGRTYTLLCPHPQHNERTPSFHIYPPAHYCCFGCQIKGDQISFVQMMENCSFVDAVRKLQIYE